ncbi:MAG: rhamnulokinase family protein [Planctomycetota bacterium]
MKDPSFIAYDIGASSGRTVLGTLVGRQLEIQEMSRFTNEMLHLHGHWHWDIYRLFHEMKKGLQACAAEQGKRLTSLAVDTWGVDFGLLSAGGSLLGLPFAYRDSRTAGVMERFFEKMPQAEVYRRTGIQFMSFNTLFQLYAMKLESSPLIDQAEDLLFMPDLCNFFFTGEKRSEFTYATTSQLCHPESRTWDPELFASLGLPSSWMQEIADPGSVLGPLDRTVLDDTAAPAMQVIQVASHDTACAVAAVPARGEGWAFISSGTWSLLGVERKKPLLTEQAREMNFTNEGGMDRTIRFLKNISGLWLLQQCKAVWDRNPAQRHNYDPLLHGAESAAPFRFIVDPDHESFLNPKDMPEAIRSYCRRTGQPLPESPFEFTRGILESLALKYRFVLDQLKQISTTPIHCIHVIGGGARNALLCQFTADATGLPVFAGPLEATAIGNIMIQVRTLGHVDSLAEMREVVRNSFTPRCYEPGSAEGWAAAYERCKALIT